MKTFVRLLRWIVRHPWALIAGLGTWLLAAAGRRRPAAKAASAASAAATASGLEAAAAHQEAQEAKADAKLAQEQAAIGGMGDDALLADAAARVRRERAERIAGWSITERHRD